MRARAKILRSAGPFLDEGEQVQAAFTGQSIAQWWQLGCFLVAGQITIFLHAHLIVVALVPFAVAVAPDLITTHRNVVVTDRRILVLARSPLIASKATAVGRNLRRNTRIGPATGAFYKTTALGERLFVAKGYAPQIEAADRLKSPSPSWRPGEPRRTS
jgi:hypothetical protein